MRTSLETPRPSLWSRRAFAMVAWLGIACAALAAQPAAAQADALNGGLNLSAAFEPGTAKPGDVVALIVRAELPEGARLRSLAAAHVGQPASALTLDAGDEALQPSGGWHDVSLDVADAGGTGQLVAGDGASFRQVFRVALDAEPGEAAVEATARLLLADGREHQASLRAALTVQARDGGNAFLDEYVNDIALVPSEGRPVVHAYFEPATASPGGVSAVRVEVHMPSGVHTYPVAAATSGFSAELSLGGAAASWNAAGPWRDASTVRDGKMHGTVVYERTMRIPAHAVGAVHVPVSVAIQPCTAIQCFDVLELSAVATLAVDRPATAADRTDGTDDPFGLDGGLGGGADLPTPSFRAYFEPAVGRPGERVLLVLEAESPPGFHMYPTFGQDFALPTLIETVRLPEWMTLLGTWHNPENLATDEHGTRHFKGIGRFVHEVRIAEDAPPERGAVSFEVTYQYCDDVLGTCYTPEEPAVVLAQMRIEPGESRELPRLVPSETSEDAEPADGESEEKAPAPAPAAPAGGGGFENLGLLGVIALAFVSLLTPCVFPMIPITIAHFTNLATPRGPAAGQPGGLVGAPAQTRASRGRMLALALTYAAAIVLTFTIVAVVFTAIYGAAFAQDLGSNSWLNLFLAGLMVVFALSFLGLFEIRLPSSLTTKLQAGSGNAGAYVGTFLMGVGFTLASFACTAPILGFVVTIGLDQGQMATAVLYTLVYAVAFALPFVGLALAPGLLSKLPNSGPWMVRVKVLFAFVLLLVVPYFMVKADLGFGWDLMSRSLILSFWAATMVVLAMYLLGQIRFHLEGPRDHVGALPAIFAILSLTLALYIAVGAVTGRPVFSHVFEATLGVPAAEAEAEAAAGARPAGDAVAEPELSWHYTYEAARTAAIDAGTPLFVDFTGYFCANCKVNEAAIFPDPGVRELFGKMTLAKIYTDAHLARGRATDEQVEAVGEHRAKLRQFGGAGAPYYVVIDPQTETVFDRVGGLTNVERFTEMLQQGLDAFEASR